MLGQYGFGSGGSYGQHRAPMGFGGGGRMGSQMNYGAYTPPQGLGQMPQSQYSSYTPQQNSGFGSQQMGASQFGGLGGGTASQTLGGGQFYHVQPEAYMGPNGYGIGGGTGAISRPDASRLNQSSGGFMRLEQLPGLADTNVQGQGYNMLTGLLEASPWAPQAPQQPDTSGLGGMTWNPSSNGWGYAGLNNPEKGGDGIGLSSAPSASLTAGPVWGIGSGIPAGWKAGAYNPYGAK